MYNLREIKHDPLQDDNRIIYENHNNNFISVCLSGSKSSAPQNTLTSCRHIYIDATIYRYIYIYNYVIYTWYDMILCCKMVEYIESRPVDITCCLVASRNTAKLWATHGYTHVIAKLSDQTPVLATSKSGPALKPCMQLGYKILMNKKGAMVRDSNSLQSSCKADAALVDHVRLRSCFISPSIPVAPNARFSVPPMHVTGRTRGESNPTVTQLPPGTSASKSTTVATLFSGGSASKWSVLKRPPPGPPILTSFAKSNLSQAWQLAFVIYLLFHWCF